ncbi:MAG: hypothetical protein HOB51_06525 [Thaumarchaeota archaeon]|nr:hypothetical protein [Nitrososphaerota archaeon]
MFRRVDRTTTERRQLLDDTTEDEEIETKIKECQRENGRCMVSTSRRLRIFYGDEKVNRILRRLSRRRERGNQYQDLFSL